MFIVFEMLASVKILIDFEICFINKKSYQYSLNECKKAASLVNSSTSQCTFYEIWLQKKLNTFIKYVSRMLDDI